MTHIEAMKLIIDAAKNDDMHRVIELARKQQDKFCDKNCVWTDHHPDCVRAEQFDHQKAAQNGLRKAMNRSQEIAKSAQPKVEQDRHELQKDGKHPAPCARFCEANAFYIEIRGLKRRIEQLTPQPQKPLTDEQIKHMLELFVIPPHHVEMVVRAIEAAHNIKE